MGRREREKGRRRKEEEEKSIKQEHIHVTCTSYPNMVVVLFGPMNFAISKA